MHTWIRLEEGYMYPQGLALELILFNVFITEFGRKVSMLMIFVDDTKLCSTAGT